MADEETPEDQTEEPSGEAAAESAADEPDMSEYGLDADAADEAEDAGDAAEKPPAAAAAGNVLGDLDDDKRRAVYDVSVDIVAVLGTAELKISQILQLGRGAVVELQRLIGEPVELHAERQLVARGEVVVIEDRLGIQLTEVIREKQY